MEYEELKEIAERHGLDGEKFATFMTRRFAYIDEGYAQEWAERLLSSNPERYMDALTEQIYHEVYGE